MSHIITTRINHLQKYYASKLAHFSEVGLRSLQTYLFLSLVRTCYFAILERSGDGAGEEGSSFAI